MNFNSRKPDTHPHYTRNFSSQCSKASNNPRVVQMSTEEFIEDPPKKHQTFIAWSIISMVLFLPVFVFWIPALIFAIRAKHSYFKDDDRNGSWYANLSRIFNISCLIFGLIFYLNAMISVPMIVTRDIHYHILVIMVPILFISILHVIRFIITVIIRK